MRKKLILIAVLAILLVAMLLTRCGKKDTQTLSKDGNGDAVQTFTGVDPAKTRPLGKVESLPDNGGITITVEENGESVVHTFIDVTADAWYVDALNYVVSGGWMDGSTDESGKEQFRPDYGVTRVQLASILYRYAGGESVAAQHSYSDVKSEDWYYDCVNWADSEGLLGGVNDERYGVDEFLTCEQAIIVLHRLAGKPKPTATLEDYPYAPKVSDYGMDAVRWAWGEGLLDEKECVWYPTQAISRAQVAQLLMRYDMLTLAAD